MPPPRSPVSPPLARRQRLAADAVPPRRHAPRFAGARVFAARASTAPRSLRAFRRRRLPTSPARLSSPTRARCHSPIRRWRDRHRCDPAWWRRDPPPRRLATARPSGVRAAPMEGARRGKPSRCHPAARVSAQRSRRRERGKSGGRELGFARRQRGTQVAPFTTLLLALPLASEASSVD